MQEIKAEERTLDGELADYEPFVREEDRAVYQSLLSDYEIRSELSCRVPIAS